MRIAFSAPLKPPDHPVPSGDRQMARLLVAALKSGGHEVEVATSFRSFLATPDPERMRRIEAEARRESDRLTGAWAEGGPPDLWFCYHPYYKAPDLIGPAVAARFGLPVVQAEASHANKRASGPWAMWHRINEEALRAADLHVCFTRRDAEGLSGLVDPGRILRLPPFIAGAGPDRDREPADATTPVRLVTVAMMRAGDKATSFAVLAEALKALPPQLDWRMTIVGDGPERAAVEAWFAPLPAARVAWTGERDGAGVAEALTDADLYVWPGFGEAYGVAFLEAAAAGLPCLAMDCGGIDSVVLDDRTGVLTPEGDLRAFVDALAALIVDPARRLRLGSAGHRMVRDERTVACAASTLSDRLSQIRSRPSARLERGP